METITYHTVIMPKNKVPIAMFDTVYFTKEEVENWIKKNAHSCTLDEYTLVIK
jgi:hypothetical protein